MKKTNPIMPFSAAISRNILCGYAPPVICSKPLVPAPTMGFCINISMANEYNSSLAIVEVPPIICAVDKPLMFGVLSKVATKAAIRMQIRTAVSVAFGLLLNMTRKYTSNPETAAISGPRQPTRKIP